MHAHLHDKQAYTLEHEGCLLHEPKCCIMLIAVDIATRLRVGRSELQIPVAGRKLSPNYPYRVQGPPILLFNWYLESVSELKRPRCEFNPPSGPEVKKEWNYASIPLYALMAWKQTNLPLHFTRTVI
jgi:hypothetical protein